MLRIYRTPAFSISKTNALLHWIHQNCSDQVIAIKSEVCYYIELTEQLTEAEMERLMWLLSETFEPQCTQWMSFLDQDKQDDFHSQVIEVGPRMNFSTAWATNAVAICEACGLTKIKRMERSRRYLLQSVHAPLTAAQRTILLHHIHDRMTEQEYVNPLTSFAMPEHTTPELVKIIPIMKEGRQALEKLNQECGYGFDEFDIDYYTKMFQEKLGRDPTDVECFDMAQSNSEHSRHWFFGGKLVLDKVPMKETLFQMVKQTLTEQAKANSVIAFHDNSSVIRGHSIPTLFPTEIGKPSSLVSSMVDESHVLLTAETHNFPSGVAPFAGAETGTGGRIRDVQATGRGAHVLAGISAYAVGNLQLPGYSLPWEQQNFEYPLQRLASPLDIEIQASNGASDYGNKFGEPVVTGFSRSFGLRLPCGERREYVKPIMFSAGVGKIDNIHCVKGEAETGLWVVKVGGPAYRIGMGGGAASSRVDAATDGISDHLAELDFNAVQRGDAEMENKMNRVIRSCIEMRDKNPIVSIHDQGAGGNGNVLKEIVEPTKQVGGGARYNVRNILVGDETLSVLEIWGAEYQENNALLIREQHLPIFKQICHREKSPYCILGQVTGDGKVVLFDERDNSTPVNLPLELVLADMPQKTFTDTKRQALREPLALPADITVAGALDRVLRLLSVASKRFLTTKVDRSVSGLIAQQQCVGPLHIPLSNVAVVAQSHFPTMEGTHPGVATACGEQPVKGLINAAAMARLSVGEALTNLMWARITDLSHCKCSANWMWAAKLPGEACLMYEACKAMRDVMLEVGVSVDGGKDSLSMSTQVGKEQVKAPGTLVITMYAACPNVEQVITPDLKGPTDEHSEATLLLYVDLGNGKHRLGGSALAHVYSQIGNESPDVDDAQLLKHAFQATQEAIAKDYILSGHDRSDGGIITTLLEMCFAGNCGVDVNFGEVELNGIDFLFSEELGFLLEVSNELRDDVIELYQSFDVTATPIGYTTSRADTEKHIRIQVNNQIVLDESMVHLRDTWEATGFELERQQANPDCVRTEQFGLRNRLHEPKWALTYKPQKVDPEWQLSTTGIVHRVMVLREEGSNGDREMQSAFYTCGMEPWDVTMNDLVEQRISLDQFQGIAFVGGFSFADVLGSAKGWAGVAKFHSNVWKQLQHFRSRVDTFSLGVCNGCQLMSLLGWVSPKEVSEQQLPRFIENNSGRYESRFVSVKIEASPAVLLKEMAGSSMGVWIAHGEGKAHFEDSKILDAIVDQHLAPIRYVDDDNVVTESYPFNPNGSPHGIAGLCSPDGRHLCLMPHPERCFLKWQFPWMPHQWKQQFPVSPWLKLFQNAKQFCIDHST